MSYHGFAKLIHWVLVPALWAMFIFGQYIERMTLGPENFHLIPLHKALGLCLFALILIRLGWRLTHRVEADNMAAIIVHWVLYALMIVAPLSGWVASSATGFSIPIFGLFNAPLLVGENEAIAKIGFQVHGASAFGIIVLSLGHGAMAIYRSVVKKDGTLGRMWFAR